MPKTIVTKGTFSEVDGVAVTVNEGNGNIEQQKGELTDPRTACALPVSSSNTARTKNLTHITRKILSLCPLSLSPSPHPNSTSAAALNFKGEKRTSTA